MIDINDVPFSLSPIQTVLEIDPTPERYES